MMRAVTFSVTASRHVLLSSYSDEKLHQAQKYVQTRQEFLHMRRYNRQGRTFLRGMEFQKSPMTLLL